MPINQSSDIDFDEFKKLCDKHTSNAYFFLVLDTTLPPEALRFCKNEYQNISVKTFIGIPTIDSKFQFVLRI